MPAPHLKPRAASKTRKKSLAPPDTAPNFKACEPLLRARRKPTGEVFKYAGLRTSEAMSLSSAQVGLMFQHNVLALLPVVETLLDVDPVSQANGLVLGSVNVIMLKGIL